jgi:hypothetical protein
MENAVDTAISSQNDRAAQFFDRFVAAFATFDPLEHVVFDWNRDSQ